MASNYPFTTPQMHLLSISNASHAVGINTNVTGMIGTLPWFLRTTISPLVSGVVRYLMNIDDSYTLNVADTHLSDPECHSVLRTIGARIEDFKRSNLCSYFNTSECTFTKKIWYPGDISSYVDDIVKFCAAAQGGHINTTALTHVLSLLLKEKISREHTTVNATEKIVVYSNRNDQCGVMRLIFTGEQLEITNCCWTGKEITLCVKKDVIMFRNTQDLLHTLRTFVQANQ